jgi:hypothetical protein
MHESLRIALIALIAVAVVKTFGPKVPGVNGVVKYL